jgi:hypothetical protein
MELHQVIRLVLLILLCWLRMESQEGQLGEKVKGVSSSATSHASSGLRCGHRSRKYSGPSDRISMPNTRTVLAGMKVRSASDEHDKRTAQPIFKSTHTFQV